MRAPLSAQAIGHVRQLRTKLGVDAKALTGPAWRIPEATIMAAAFKGTAGAERAWARILAAMPCPPLLWGPNRRTALWRLLRPSGAVLDTPTGRDQGDAAVVVSCIALGLSRGRAVRKEAPWGLSVTNHALGRLAERTGFRADAAAVMIEAHDLLLAAPAAVGRTMLEERRWAIPAGAGAFLTTTRVLDYTGGDAIVLVTAETWLSADQLRPEQAAQVAAVRFQAPGRTLGQGMLLPAVLRAMAAAQEGDGGRVVGVRV